MLRLMITPILLHGADSMDAGTHICMGLFLAQSLMKEQKAAWQGGSAQNMVSAFYWALLWILHPFLPQTSAKPTWFQLVLVLNKQPASHAKKLSVLMKEPTWEQKFLLSVVFSIELSQADSNCHEHTLRLKDLIQPMDAVLMQAHGMCGGSENKETKKSTVKCVFNAQLSAPIK